MSHLHRVVTDSYLLIENLEVHCISLRLHNLDLHSGRKRLFRLKDEVEATAQSLGVKLQQHDQVSRDLEWARLQLSGLQIAYKNQRASSSKHKKHCLSNHSNDFNEQRYDEMIFKICKLQTSISKSEDTLKIFLSTLSGLHV